MKKPGREAGLFIFRAPPALVLPRVPVHEALDLGYVGADEEGAVGGEDEAQDEGEGQGEARAEGLGEAREVLA
jgi:hypothetical protein